MINTPINFRGKLYSTKKSNNGKKAHLLSSTELLERVKPCCNRMGLTRIADITGFDRIGIPHYNTIRPIRGGSSISHGKGISGADAKASAVMESIERYTASVCEPPYFEMTYNQLKDQHQTIPIQKLRLANRSIFNPDSLEAWVIGWDIIHNEEVAVPYYEAVLSPHNIGLSSFQKSSNGLASGMDILESISQGLFEVIERDAIACHYMAAAKWNPFQPYPLKRVILETIKDGTIQELFNRIQTSSIFPILFDCTSDNRIPTFECILADELWPNMIITRGMGTHLIPETAMIRAITEASLARAVYLSGCRENFFATDMHEVPITTTQRLNEIIKTEKHATWVQGDQYTEPIIPETFQGDINLCLQRLKETGITQVIVLDLTLPGFNVYVTKVIVPGLEGVHDLLNYTPGERAMNCLKRGTV